MIVGLVGEVDGLSNGAGVVDGVGDLLFERFESNVVDAGFGEVVIDDAGDELHRASRGTWMRFRLLFPKSLMSRSRTVCLSCSRCC